MFLSVATQSVMAFPPPERLLEMQDFRPCSRLTDPEAAF